MADSLVGLQADVDQAQAEYAKHFNVKPKNEKELRAKDDAMQALYDARKALREEEINQGLRTSAINVKVDE